MRRYINEKIDMLRSKTDYETRIYINNPKTYDEVKKNNSLIRYLRNEMPANFDTVIKVPDINGNYLLFTFFKEEHQHAGIKMHRPDNTDIFEGAVDDCIDWMKRYIEKYDKKETNENNKYIMNKKQLYEQIMRSVSVEVKKALNESFLLEHVNPEVFPGDKIRIIRMDDNNGADWAATAMAGKEGYIESIDDIGQLHGTWGGLAIVPDVDEYEIVED